MAWRAGHAMFLLLVSRTDNLVPRSQYLEETCPDKPDMPR